MSDIFGNALKLTLFGESHGVAVGMVLEGFPAGFCPDFDRLQAFLDRRAPGKALWASARRESDHPTFLSGFYRGASDGAPIAAIIRNEDTRSADYVQQSLFRPAHADFPAHVKYAAHNDPRGGGHFSGRLTAPMCIAGALCAQWLEARGIRIFSHILQIGSIRDRSFDPLAPQLPTQGSALSTLESSAGEAMVHEILAAKAEGDSVGGCIECAVTGLPVGVGEPPFDGLENRLAQILFSIPAVKGVEFGSGFACASMRGSAHNDGYHFDADGLIRTQTNHAGGALGGLSTGMPLIFRLAIKPTPSIAQPQQSVSPTREGVLQIVGRHDPCIVPRALVCAEAAAAVALMGLILEGQKWN